MKLLASDFDGTLAFKNKIKESDIKKIQDFQKAGHLFGLATGRNLKGILNITQPYGLHFDFLVLASGSKIIDEKGHVFFNKPLSKEIVQKIYLATQYSQEYMFFNENENCIINPLKVKNINIPVITNINELKENEYSFMAIHFEEGQEEMAQKATDFINEHFGKDVIAYRNTINVDIVHAGCSKGNGVLEIAKHFNLSKEDIYVIGDSLNDITMFDITQHAYSFKHIEETLKSHVNEYVDSVEKCIDDILKREENKS